MFIENKTTEFKREYVEDIKNTVIAFANTDGGKIFIGINNDGSAHGVSDRDGTLLKVTNAIRDGIRPDVTLFTDCAADEVDGKPVITVDVQRGTARPYYLAGKGVRPEGVFVRQGASTVPATETAILNMIKETSGDCYEDARSIHQNLTFEKATDFFAKRKVDFRESQKRTLHVIGSDGTYTNLGLLLSDQCVHTLKLAVFEGGKKSIFKDRRELTGSILDQLEEAYTYIDRYNRTRAEFEGLNRIELRDYPPQAVREALLNAIVHRDYAYSSSSLIRLFDDRIEFVTIGGLIRGISFEDIMLGISVLRNPHLAHVFYRLSLIEAYGTGMLKIRESYREYSVKPQIEATGNAFKITLPNTNYTQENSLTPPQQNQTLPLPAPKNERGNALARLFDRQDTIVRKDIENTFHVSQATAILLVRKMVENGTLIKEGSGKNVRYRLGKAK